MKLLVLLVGSCLNLLTLLLGGIFYTDWKLSLKYGILIIVIPKKYDCQPMAAADFLGGIVYLPEEWKDDEVLPFVIWHEKGHCRTWRGIPYELFAIRKAHGTKTAAYEYAADKYAADAGYRKLGISCLMESYRQTKDRDNLRRANALRRLK